MIMTSGGSSCSLITGICSSISIITSEIMISCCFQVLLRYKYALGMGV